MFKIGHGYDLHKLVLNRPLILCGEKIPFEKGLIGHSDADVAVHALIDSLLGAACMHDIGYHFPDNDKKYKNISSLKLLEKVKNMLEKENFLISNIDITLVLQYPKIAPFTEKMRRNLAKTLNITQKKINIKATTEEHVGITGSGSCIACFCSSLIYSQNLNIR